MVGLQGEVKCNAIRTFHFLFFALLRSFFFCCSKRRYQVDPPPQKNSRRVLFVIGVSFRGLELSGDLVDFWKGFYSVAGLTPPMTVRKGRVVFFLVRELGSKAVFSIISLLIKIQSLLSIEEKIP